MDKDLRIKIKIDSETAKLDILNTKINSTSKGFNQADSMASAFTSRLASIGGAVGGLYLVNKTLGDITRTGFEVNRTMQTLTNSLTMSSAVMMGNIDSMGNSISTTEKYRLATMDASSSLEKLQKINLETPHTLEQTVKLYDSMYMGMSKVGANTNDMIEITKKLSIAVGNKVGFDAMLSAMDGLSTGTVETASEMGRFLNSIGLTNEAIKNSADVVQLFKDKLSDFKAITDFNTKMSNLTNSTDLLSKNLTKIPFDYLESKIPFVSSLFDQWAKSVNEVNIYLTDTSKLTTYNELINKQYQLLGQIQDVKNDKFMWGSDQKEKLTELNAELELTYQKLGKIREDDEKLKNKTTVFDSKPIEELVSKTLNPYGAKLDEINKKWQTPFEDMQKNKKDTTNIYAAWTKEISDLDKEEADKKESLLKKASDSSKKMAIEAKKTAKEIAEVEAEYALVGLSEWDTKFQELDNKYNADLVKYKDVSGAKEKLESIHTEKIKELTSQRNNEIEKQDLSYYERLIQLKSDSYEKEVELANIAYAQKTIDIQDASKPLAEKEKLISLETELYNKTVERIGLDNQSDQLEKTSTAYQDMLDAQISLIDATNDWNSNLTGTAAALADVASATTNLSKLNLTALKNEDKLRTEYEKNKLKFYDNEEKLKELDTKYAKDKASLDDKNVSATIVGYANIAGALSSMYEDGSKGAATFQIAQSALALVEGTRAILTAGTGDPYTAIPRMIAMAATVSSLFSNIGIAFGMNTTTTSSDAFSSLEANTGTGTVLGDATAQSESITNALSTLEDYAKPEYQTLLSMNNYLKNISDNIGGVTSLLIQQGGFSFGEGYEGFDTGFKSNLSINSGIMGVLNPISLTNSLLKDIPILGEISGLFSNVINSVLGGLFGKTSVSQALTDSGIYFTDTLLTSAIQQMNGDAFQTIATTVKKKSWFSSSSKTSVSTYFQDLDNETNRQFSLVLDGLYNTVLLAGEALDSSAISTAASLENFVVSIGKISLNGKTGDEIQEALTSIFGAIGDDIASTAFPLLTAFQGVGEGMFETLTRVATGMEEADYYISRLGNGFSDIIYTAIGNKQGDVGFEALLQSIKNFDEATYGANNNLIQIVASLDMTAEELYTVYTTLDELRDRLIFLGQSSSGISSSMIYGAGSVDALTSGFTSYFDNFLSESEQLDYKTQQLTQSFTSLGLSMPSTNVAFKDLLSGLDLTSSAGQELYGRLIILSDSFSEISNLKVSVLTDELDATNTTISSIESITSSLDSVVSNLRSSIDTSSGTSLDAFARSMTTSLLLAQSGDYTALSSSVADTISYSSALNNSDYFSSTRDMQYAQAVAANQFESMNVNLDTELSVLQEIALNTNNMIAALSSLTTAVATLQTSSEATAINTAASRYVS